jgi:hypothetical protein
MFMVQTYVILFLHNFDGENHSWKKKMLGDYYKYEQTLGGYEDSFYNS